MVLIKEVVVGALLLSVAAAIAMGVAKMVITIWIPVEQGVKIIGL